MTALITAKTGKTDALREALRIVVAKTNEEPGCLEFRIFEDTEVQGRFILWETFASQEALTVHINKDYTREYFASGLMERTQVLRMRSFA